MVELFLWNDVDMIFILNLDLKLITIFFNIMPLMGTTSYSVYQCWILAMLVS